MATNCTWPSTSRRSTRHGGPDRGESGSTRSRSTSAPSTPGRPGSCPTTTAHAIGPGTAAPRPGHGRRPCSCWACGARRSCTPARSWACSMPTWAPTRRSTPGGVTAAGHRSRGTGPPGTVGATPCRGCRGRRTPRPATPPTRSPSPGRSPTCTAASWSSGTPRRRCRRVTRRSSRPRTGSSGGRRGAGSDQRLVLVNFTDLDVELPAGPWSGASVAVDSAADGPPADAGFDDRLGPNRAVILAPGQP